LVWGLAIPRPRYEILVRKQDLQRALELVNGISERPAFALGKTPEWAFEEREPAESGGGERSVAQSGAQNEVPDDLVPKFRAKDANLEVWSGEETDMGQMLEASLGKMGLDASWTVPVASRGFGFYQSLRRARGRLFVKCWRGRRRNSRR
jgi:hypothetical protein